MPRSVGAAADAVLAARGQAEQLMRIVDRSPVPMLIVDNQRRYREVNIPARLAFRLSLAEMRKLAVDDLVPPDRFPEMEAIWAQLLETGYVVGRFMIAGGDGSHFDVVYAGLSNALPGRHTFAFAPAAWPADELAIPEDEGTPDPPTPLTRRELEVLQLAAHGLDGPRIAEKLVLSPWTVKTHFQRIYTKLDVRDRAGAVATAMRLGIVD